MKQTYRQTLVQSSHQDTMFSVLLIMFFLYPDPSFCVSLESLLQSHITSSQCTVRCSSESGQERMKCMEVCPLVVSSSSPYLCNLTQLCRGGCRTACTTEEQSVSLTSLYLTTCSLTWTSTSMITSVSPMFLVAGQDKGGMWHLVATVTSHSLPRHTIASYTKVRILLISSNGVMDRSEVTVEEEDEDCKELQPSNKSQHVYMNLILPWRSILFMALPVILAIIFLGFFLFLNCCKKNRKDISEDRESSRTTDDKFYLDQDLLDKEEKGEEVSEKTFHSSLY